MASGNAAPLVAWIANAAASGNVGALVGMVLVIIVRQLTRHPERLIVHA